MRLPPGVDDALFEEFLSLQRLGLEELEAEILALEHDGSTLPQLRRRIHTTKGEAGVLGLEDLSRLCHAVEDLLKRPMPSDQLADRLLLARDWMSAAIQAYARREHAETSADEVIATLAAPSASPPEQTVAAESSGAGASAGASPEASPTLRPGAGGTETLFETFRQESAGELRVLERRVLELAHAGEATAEDLAGLVQVLRSVESGAAVLQLGDVGLLTSAAAGLVQSIEPGVPPALDRLLELLSESVSMLERLLAERDAPAGRPVPPPPGFDPLLEMLQAASQGELPTRSPRVSAKAGARLGEILTAEGAVSDDALQEALDRQQGSGRRLGEQLVDQGASRAKDVARALRAQQRAAAPGPAQRLVRETVKVDLARVDALVEMVGEMVTIESMIAGSPELAQRTTPRLHDTLRQLTKTTRDLQQLAMQLRMVPLRGLFQRMARTARDVARRAGRSVHVQIRGETTEMDRSMVEHLADPLVHLVRNAVDHGIEPTPRRLALGKPPAGTLRLEARHEGGAIVVEIVDDGAGLDRTAILRRAQEQGLVDSDAPPADEDLWQLIFRAGFSTARQVTELSGRGVGLDVVRQNVERLRGRIRVLSQPGVGTTFRLVLPLTLAVIDGMVVACGAERYILPTLAVVECMQPAEVAVLRVTGRHELLKVRDQVLPLLRLGDVLDIPAACPLVSEALAVILETADGRLALLVDEVVTQQQVVIKRLAGLPGQRHRFAGSAILYDGNVALILDPDELHRLRGARGRQAVREG